MLCDKCNINQATVYTSYNINGEIFENHLCSECAKENSFKPFSGLDSFFSDLATGFYDPISEIRGELICSKCGTTLAEFKETSKFGCQECYKTFKKYVDQVIANVQYGEIHTGKSIEELDSRDKKIVELQLQLKRAVEEENYELASEIKKRIQSFRDGE